MGMIWVEEKHLMIRGNPKALKRHRDVTLKNGKRIRYDPSKGDKADFLAQVLPHAPETPYDEPLIVDLSVYIPRPKYHYRTGKHAGELKENAPKYVDKKPDKDNYEKFVFDALNGIFWRDDAIIVSGRTTKYYSEVPGVGIIIKRLRKEKDE
jgi:Holliday junction resolvase RusA-like endonuclease